MENTQAKEKFPLGKFFLWKTRDVALGANVVVLGYLMIFCTNVLGMDAGVVGTLLMVSKIFDGVTDLFAGYIVDNTNTRFGKARPYELCIIGLWLATIAMFFCPVNASSLAKSLWIFAAYTFVNSVFTTMLNACQTPYMIRVFGSRNQIVKVSSFGGIVSTLGSAIVSISFPRLMGTLGTSAGGWHTLILIFAIPLMLIGILRFLFVKETVQVSETAKSEHVSMNEVLTMLKKNKYAWLLAGMMGFYNITLGMNGATYYFTVIVGDISKYSTLQALTIPMLLIMFIFPKLMKKYSAPQLIMIGAASGVFGYLLNFLANGNMTILMIAFLFTSFAALPVAYLQALMIMDLATYNEYLGYHRMEGTCGAVSGFATKLCNGLGTGLIGMLLGAAGYVGTAAVQTQSAMNMIKTCYSIIPAICWGVVIACAVGFNGLTRKIPEYEADIKERQASEAAD